MNHVKVLGIKFVAISITVMSIFGIFDHVSLGSLLTISLLTTVFSYLLGDMFVLRKFGNVAASLSDFVLAFASLWILGSIFVVSGFPVLMTSLLSAFFIACVEPFIHEYILHNFTDFNEEAEREPRREVQTEFAEESDVHDIRSKQDDYDGKKL